MVEESPSRERLFAKVAEWSTEASQAQRGRLDAEVVHKTLAENVAVARIERYDGGEPDRCLAEILVDTKHPYFFEHPIDHVPALLLIEAVRQAGVAAIHFFLDVPLDAAMIVDDFSITFQKYAELDAPLFVEMRSYDKGYSGERLTSAKLQAEFIQGGEVIGRSTSRARMVWWAR